jgi:hypothetical protein
MALQGENFRYGQAQALRSGVRKKALCRGIRLCERLKFREPLAKPYLQAAISIGYAMREAELFSRPHNQPSLLRGAAAPVKPKKSGQLISG